MYQLFNKQNYHENVRESPPGSPLAVEKIKKGYLLQVSIAKVRARRRRRQDTQIHSCMSYEEEDTCMSYMEEDTRRRQDALIHK